MKTPVVSITWSLEVKNKWGRVLTYRTEPSHSYVRAFIDWLYAHFSQVGVALVPDTLGVNRTIANAASLNPLGPNNNSLYGPVLGTGSNAVAITDNALQTQIVHGVGAGQLDHELTAGLGLVTAGSTRSFEYRRLFVNASGGVITANECGIYFTSGTFYFCAVRDLVSGGVAIPNGGTATLIYTISISV